MRARSWADRFTAEELWNRALEAEQPHPELARAADGAVWLAAHLFVCDFLTDLARRCDGSGVRHG